VRGAKEAEEKIMVQVIAWFAFGALVFGWLMALTVTALEARATTRLDRETVYAELNRLQKERNCPPRAPSRVEIVDVPLPGGGDVKALSSSATRRLVEVTRDDDPIHTRATVVTPISKTTPAPPPEFEAGATSAEGESSEELTQVMVRLDGHVLDPGREGATFPGGKGGSSDSLHARALSEAS
jgi:hypothetical protein